MFARLALLATGIAFTLAAGLSQAAVLQSQYGILDLTANGGINPNTGVAWQAGDQYRLAFFTDGKINGTSNDPGVYDAFATAQANLSNLGNGGIQTSTGWTAMVWVNTDPNQAQGAALSSPVVRSGTTAQNTANQGGDGVPVYAMNGTTAIARNNADIYNAWSNPFEDRTGDVISVNPNGTGNNVARIIFAPYTSGGNDPHYSPFLNQYGLGDTGVTHGVDVITGGFNTHVNAVGPTTSDNSYSYGSSNANNTGRVWNRFTETNLNNARSVYVLSPILTVTEVPEPGSIALLSLGALLIARRRRR